MAKIIEAGDRQYELVEGWGQLPSGWQWGQVGGVAVDSGDNVHVFTRMEHPYLVFDKGGKMVDRWGEGIFEDAHGICITPDDTAYFVDRFSQQLPVAIEVKSRILLTHLTSPTRNITRAKCFSSCERAQ